MSRIAQFREWVFEDRDEDGRARPASGAKAYLTRRGESAPLLTYLDETMMIAACWPVIADSAGRVQVWIDPESLPVTVRATTSDGRAIAIGELSGPDDPEPEII